MNQEKTTINWVIAAGVVGADIGTSIFYSTGILWPIVGYLAPLCILFVCFMMWFFKATYEEGLALSPYNGGAYVMILRTMGRQAAVLAGALTVVSYLATAAVSALSGAGYISSLFPDYFNSTGSGMDPKLVLLSFIPIVLFGFLNCKGIKEPAKIVTGIAGFHFALLIVIVIWGSGFLMFGDVDFSKLSNFKPGGTLTFSMIIYGFATAFLGISGFESAAQIVEELEEPVLKTVRKLYFTVVLLVSITGPAISFLCLVVLSEPEVNQSKDYLLAALGGKLGGTGLQSVIVVDAILTLFAAVNTAFVGFIGLATTMSKQGNLPQFLLTRINHKFPSITGYPFIALPFMLIAIAMAAIVSGQIDVIGHVYGMAFLGVMVSFCLGVVFLRNKAIRKNTPKKYLTNIIIKTKNNIIPVIPTFAGIILFAALLVLVIFAHDFKGINLLIELLALVLLVMSFYRWGVLEKRLERRTDLRLGLGRFKGQTDIPYTLTHYVVCTAGTRARHLITTAIKYLLSQEKGPFEVTVFHAEDSKDDESFFEEILQRVISQQIVPVFENKDFVISVKTLPGDFIEGLQTLKRSHDFKTLLIGTGKQAKSSAKISELIRNELDVDVVNLGGYKQIENDKKSKLLKPIINTDRKIDEKD